ncbi:type-1 angiotensin II receptor-associated protein [Hoplias malabaricus]|uniref:type-1 angiotensin II receptor-associated protein n=1 Tax=Hoplias malabaricus TaxID=27720 RepID=UPI0034633D45
MEIPAINLKAIVLVHWLLTIWACICWQLPSYYLGNFSMLAVGVWAIAQRDSIDAVLMFLIGMTVTILTDIVHFGIFYAALDRQYGMGSLVRFSSGMAILSLILKPLSCFFVYQMYRERGGDYNINFGFPTVTRDRNNYQSIDQPNQPTPGKAFSQPEEPKPAARAY